MKANLPLVSKPKRLMHSRFIPAWEDAFDLRTYFACIDPGQYELQDEAELGSAQTLFGIVQEFSVKWVTLYRAIVRALPEHEEALGLVMRGFESLLGSDRGSHLAWCQSPQSELDGKCPEVWLIGQGLVDLARALQFYTPVEKSDLTPELPLQTNIGHDMSVVLLRQTSAEGERLLNSEQRSLLRTVRSLFSPDEWDDEFDLAPYFAAWSPLLHVQAEPPVVRNLVEVHGVVTRQVLGWVRVYRAALAHACGRAGVMAAVTCCAEKNAAVDRSVYLDWYYTPQGELFGGLSPAVWFEQHGSEELGRHLSLGHSRIKEADSSVEEQPTR